MILRKQEGPINLHLEAVPVAGKLPAPTLETPSINANAKMSSMMTHLIKWSA